ncbi:MAG: coproporphyrinogen III oxidase family protein, partial [Anaerolineae bacterium]|nr:coproporphyrinogen III oxidase family protein [Anaerolineae bacterium]
MEAHPGAVSAAYLRDLRRLGVNRLSFGVQSGHDDTLARVGRWHTVETARRALAWARQAGFDNVGIDLIYGLPGDGPARWDATLRRVLAWQPDHISAYALMLEPGTPLACAVAAGRAAIADDDTMADMYEAAGARLAAAGFEQYELSNWAQPGRACRYNLHVWRGGDYLGVGAGAHGCVGGVRYRVTADVAAYLQRMAEPAGAPPGVSPAAEEAHPLSRREQMEEAMFLGLRLTQEGVSAQRFAARFGCDLREAFGAPLRRLVALGLIECRGDTVRLAPHARLVSNRVLAEFVSISEAKTSSRPAG